MPGLQPLQIFGKLEPESSLLRDALKRSHAPLCPLVELRRDVGVRIGNTPSCGLRDQIVKHVDHTAVYIAGGIKRAHEERCAGRNAGKSLFDRVQGLVVLRSDDHCLPCPKCSRGNGDDCLALACAGRPGYDRERGVHCLGRRFDLLHVERTGVNRWYWIDLCIMWQTNERCEGGAAEALDRPGGNGIEIAYRPGGEGRAQGQEQSERVVDS